MNFYNNQTLVILSPEKEYMHTRERSFAKDQLEKRMQKLGYGTKWVRPRIGRLERNSKNTRRGGNAHMINLARGLIDVEVSGINNRDYPDFVDAYISSAAWKDTGEGLTEEELAELNDKYQYVVHQAVMDHLY